MIQLTSLRNLDLQSGSEPDRPAFLSAASGLVAVGRYLYAVADDELHLGIFERDSQRPGSLLRLFPGDLPDKLIKRKKEKPDLEALLQLPAFKNHPHGALLALGSGSSKRRFRGALLRLNADGSIEGKAKIVDTSAWLEELAGHFGEINIEGAWISGHRIHLLQRGNKGAGINAVASSDLATLLDGLQDDHLPPTAWLRRDFMPRARRCCSTAATLALSSLRVMSSAVFFVMAHRRVSVGRAPPGPPGPATPSPRRPASVSRGRCVPATPRRRAPPTTPVQRAAARSCH